MISSGLEANRVKTSIWGLVFEPTDEWPLPLSDHVIRSVNARMSASKRAAARAVARWDGNVALQRWGCGRCRWGREGVARVVGASRRPRCFPAVPAPKGEPGFPRVRQPVIAPIHNCTHKIFKLSRNFNRFYVLRSTEINLKLKTLLRHRYWNLSRYIWVFQNLPRVLARGNYFSVRRDWCSVHGNWFLLPTN